MTIAKYGFEHVPVNNGAPPKVAVMVAPLNDGGSVTTLAVSVDTNEFEDADVCVCSVVGVATLPLGKAVTLSGEHPTKAGACFPTFEHSS